jgi:hypothetical protein
MYKAIALMFLVLWLPITSHCQLERVPGLEFLHCAADTSESSNCEGDGCQTVESGLYKISDHSTIAPVPVCGPFLFMLPHRSLEDSSLVGPGRAQSSFPPDLPQRWQFISRTALPIRAPSFAS